MNCYISMSSLDPSPSVTLATFTRYCLLSSFVLHCIRQGYSWKPIQAYQEMESVNEQSEQRFWFAIAKICGVLYPGYSSLLQTPEICIHRSVSRFLTLNLLGRPISISGVPEVMFSNIAKSSFTKIAGKYTCKVQPVSEPQWH